MQSKWHHFKLKQSEWSSESGLVLVSSCYRHLPVSPGKVQGGDVLSWSMRSSIRGMGMHHYMSLS